MAAIGASGPTEPAACRKARRRASAARLDRGRAIVLAPAARDSLVIQNVGPRAPSTGLIPSGIAPSETSFPASQPASL
jgi:hypothetical protein